MLRSRMRSSALAAALAMACFAGHTATDRPHDGWTSPEGVDTASAILRYPDGVVPMSEWRPGRTRQRLWGPPNGPPSRDVAGSWAGAQCHWFKVPG